jgi:hypothetical protein
MSAEGHITHATVGRINVERGEGSVTLRLWAWSLKPDATMTHGEARTLIRCMEEAMAPVRSKFAPPEAEDHEDLA